MLLTPDIAKIIKQRGSQTRGKAKVKMTSMVETLYNFASGHGRKTISNNRALAEELKFEKGFIYKTLTNDTRKGIYQNEIIQKAVNKMWFQNKRDEGVLYSNMFNPLLVPAIALILTAIECNIDEWSTGIKTDVPFYADDYRETYCKHIESLEVFGEKTIKYKMLDTLQKHLHNYGRLHSGATPLAFKSCLAIPLTAFEAAIKEYEENDDTDSDGEMQSN
ncbi:hypothetical protein C0993_005158 [Termitomyces sp. T159_Od127]|nr:hypothetical protein C0993_005158 [Termitomyces sp. T159_Od127]